MDQEIQVIGDEFWTIPPAPEKVPREDLLGMLAAAQSQREIGVNDLARAEESKAKTVAELDSTIAKHQDDIAVLDGKIVDIQALLDQVPE